MRIIAVVFLLGVCIIGAVLAHASVTVTKDANGQGYDVLKYQSNKLVSGQYETMNQMTMTVNSLNASLSDAEDAVNQAQGLK